MAGIGLFLASRPFGWNPASGRSRPWLFPAALLYRTASGAHAAWMRMCAETPPGPPLVIVGALRSGGSGKTSVTAALAAAFRHRGLRVGILAWRAGKGRGREAAQPVDPSADWRVFSDEAVLLARETGCPVFAARDRAAARRELAEAPFDLLLSDDGFQDRRLGGAFRILVQAPGEAPGLADLLPAGPFRETAAARSRADLVLEGPWAGDPLPGSGSEEVHLFRRRFLPPSLPVGAPCIALASLGDPSPFLADLERAGILPAAVICGPNHGEPPFMRIRAALRAHPGARVLCTAKEAVRLEGDPRAPRGLRVAAQEIALEARTLDRILASLGIGRPAGLGGLSAEKTNLVH